jgi:hypothetical protein
MKQESAYAHFLFYEEEETQLACFLKCKFQEMAET